MDCHIGNFDVKNKTASPISEEIRRILITAHPKNRILNKSTQTGRYDRWERQGNIRCQSIKAPSKEFKRKPSLKPQVGLAPKRTPTIARTVVLNSKNKRKYCAELVRKIKYQAEFDKLFNDVGCSLEKQIAQKWSPE